MSLIILQYNVPVKFNSYIIGRIIESSRNRASRSSDRAYWEQDFFHPCREPNQRKRKELIAIMEVLNFLSLFFFFCLGFTGNSSLVSFVLYFDFQASEYLGMESLVELTTQSIANYLKGKNPLTIRSFWKVEGDLSAEEEAKALAMGVAAWRN